MTEFFDYRELVTAALAAFADALTSAAARGGPRQTELERAAEGARQATVALAAGEPVRARYFLKLAVASAEAGDAWHDRSLCWELRVEDHAASLQRWSNLADEVGANQCMEITSQGTLDDPLPAAAADWGKSLAEGLLSGQGLLIGSCNRLPS
ncbi:MAG: hypothetical protein JNN30_17125 [Rhodanobacteraceae bacterium]|nr:hypothetical protein [Rhodanobacteraceae bacterium]